MASRICWTGTDLLWAGAAARTAGRVGSFGQVPQVGALSLVELQRVGDRLQDAVGDTAQVSPLELDVVVDADPGEQRHLFSVQPGDPAATPPYGQTGLLGGDLGPAEARKSRISLRLSWAEPTARICAEEGLSVPGSVGSSSLAADGVD